jgi:membrane protein required for colicin V production
MNPLDLMILATMVFLIVRGIFRGFFREVGSIAGVILGIWLATIYQPGMTEYLKAYLPHGKALPIISFALIFALILVACNMAGWGLKMLMKKTLLGWADRSLGAGLAVLKGIIITYLAIVLLTFFVPSKTPLIATSRLAPLVIRSYQSLVSVVSPGSYQRLKKRFLGTRGERPSDRPEGIEDRAVKDGST